jgi:hypothetical protein
MEVGKKQRIKLSISPAITSLSLSPASSHTTLRWRKPDSNRRYRAT